MKRNLILPLLVLSLLLNGYWLLEKYGSREKREAGFRKSEDCP